ncbi:MAG: hypothetical protein M8353_10850, partial [ANME-2 cluster archaeon]|nr:hypothetical protein [ANME-2 cluster archaeon]
PLRPGNDCSFEIVISNYGSPTHVHLSADKRVRKYVKFLHENPYVSNQEYLPVVVNLPAEHEWVEGEIKVATGYGAQSDTFKIFIGIRKAEVRTRHTVDVDERLGTPGYLKGTYALPSDMSYEAGNSAKNADVSGRHPHQFDKFIMPLLLVLIVMMVLLATFTFNMIDKLTGAVAASIILMVVLMFAVIHLLTKKE